jgi:hypothetical protein
MSVYDPIDVKLTPRQIALVVMALEREDERYYRKEGNYTRSANCYDLANALAKALAEKHPSMLDSMR